MSTFSRTIIGYHGCLANRAEGLLAGTLEIADWPKSEESFDWLGHGIYFWEHGLHRAQRWAKEKAIRDGGEPAVVGAVIDIARCLDLNDTKGTELLGAMYQKLAREYQESGISMPENRGLSETDEDLKFRELDCLVINSTIATIDPNEELFPVVRAAFPEGSQAFPGSKLHVQSHTQIAIRDPKCILGIFRPNLYT